MPEIRTQMIRYRANGQEASGYLAYPAGAGPHMGLVAIQEYWGLEPHIKDATERLARAGYCALAPDLYHGKVAKEPDEAGKLMMALDMEHALKEIEGAAAYLAGRPDVHPKKVGVMGWCMGGLLAMRWSSRSDRAGAVVAFYPGHYQPDAEEARALRAPALILYGEEDHGLPAKTREHVERELRAAGKTVEVHTYAGAGHSFFNDSKPSHRPDAAKDAWRRTLDWLEVHLKVGSRA
jgi:carboxymethylenebutenolidase